MTALTLRASQALPASPLSTLGRLVAAVAALMDVFVEARQLEAEAHRKYPFASW